MDVASRARCRLERRLEEVRHRRLGHGAQTERADRDAELRRGNRQCQVLDARRAMRAVREPACTPVRAAFDGPGSTRTRRRRTSALRASSTKSPEGSRRRAHCSSPPSPSSSTVRDTRSMRRPSMRSTVSARAADPGRPHRHPACDRGRGDAVPALGDATEHVVDQAPDRLVVLTLGQRDPGLLLDLVGTEQTRQRPRAVAAMSTARRQPVVLVGDVADDLLDQILERHDAVGAAVFVDDDGHLHALFTQQREQRVELDAVRHDRRRIDDLRDPYASSPVRFDAHGLLDVHDADDVVRALADDGKPRMPGLTRRLDDVERRVAASRK